jgi:hypothetical protein
MLWWIGRFRFVTARELSVRFGVTEQRVNARVRRFLRAGLVADHRPHNNTSRVVFLTRRGWLSIGMTPRRPPRTDIQRRHELALVMLVAVLEHETPFGQRRVLTERECRAAERRDRHRGGERWNVDVVTRYGAQRRWPDLVAVDDRWKLAIEVEFAVKHTRRLEEIVSGYRTTGTFAGVLWLVENPALARRLSRMAEERLAWLTEPVEMRVATYAPGQERLAEAILAGWGVDREIEAWSSRRGRSSDSF